MVEIITSLEDLKYNKEERERVINQIIKLIKFHAIYDEDSDIKLKIGIIKKEVYK